MRKRLAAILVITVMFAMLPGSNGHATESNGVCAAYFYSPGCDPCDEAAPYISSLEGEFPFLHLERYDVAGNYTLHEKTWRAYKDHYDVRYGIPSLYVGNRWYDLNPDHEGFNRTVAALREDLVAFEQMGGVPCPIDSEGQLRFPRPVCILAFYNQSGQELDRVEQAIRGNISYVQVTRLDGNEFSDRFKGVCSQLGVSLSLPAVVVGDRGFSLDDVSVDAVVAAAEQHEMTGVACSEGDGNGSICIVFFYSPTCPHCMDAKEKLEDLEARYPLEITSYIDLADPDLLSSYYKAANVSLRERGSFAVFVGDRHYGHLEDFDEFERYIKDHLDEGLACPEPAEEGDEEERVRELTILTVIAGGLVDGINPCAFATLVFFIAYLERARQRRRALLSIGIAFSAAVFVGYLLIGVGLLEFYYGIEQLGDISHYVYLFAGVFALGIAAFNLVDFARIGREEQTILQLPRFLKRRRGRMIRVLTGQHGVVMLAALAFATGLGISLLEFVCTGQVLFPIMAVIKQSSPLWWTAFAYLLLYTAMFIVPLLVILALFYTGFTSEKLGDWQRRHQGIVKLLTAAVLGVIGAWMLWITLG